MRRPAVRLTLPVELMVQSLMSTCVRLLHKGLRTSGELTGVAADCRHTSFHVPQPTASLQPNVKPKDTDLTSSRLRTRKTFSKLLFFNYIISDWSLSYFTLYQLKTISNNLNYKYSINNNNYRNDRICSVVDICELVLMMHTWSSITNEWPEAQLNNQKRGLSTRWANMPTAQRWQHMRAVYKNQYIYIYIYNFYVNYFSVQ